MKKYVVFGVYAVCALLTYAGFSIYAYFQLPYFSVITSVYNYEKYIGKTIESVLASDYPRFELIVINDGSTDSSLEVIRKYARKDKRIRVIDQKNSGLSVSRNKGMYIAKGDYFWFVDADDYIDSKALSKLAKHILKTNNPDFVSFFIQPINEKGELLPKNEYTKLPKILDGFKDKTFDVHTLPIHTLFIYPVTSGKQVYSRAFLKKHNIWFIPRLVFEDDCFFFTTLEAGARGAVLHEALYYKREHAQSIVHNRPQYYDSTVRLPIKLYEELKRVGVSEERARIYFTVYFGGVFGKFPGREKDIKEVEKMLSYVNQNYEYWENKKKALEDFIQTKKQGYLRKD